MSHGVASILLTADDKRLKPELKSAHNEITQFAKSSSMALKSLAFGAIVAGAAYVGGKIASVGGEMLGAYSEQESAEKKLTSVLKSTGEAAGYSKSQLLDMAKGLEKVTGVSDQVIINAEAMLATFTNIRGDIFKDATKSALDMSAVLGNDLQGQAIQLGKALNNPIQGMSALSEAGVAFTTKQKEQITALQNAGKMQEAQRIILNELAVEFGNASNATGTWTDTTGRLATRIGTLYEAGGKLMATVLMPLMPLVSGAIGIFEQMVEPLQYVAEAVAEMAAEFIGSFKPVGDLSKVFSDMATMTVALMQEWRSVVSLAVLGVIEVFVDYYSYMWHLWTELIPTVVKNGALAMMEIFSRLGEWFSASIDMWAENGTRLWQAISDAMNGKGFNFEPVSIFDKFKFETEFDKLPSQEENDIQKAVRLRQEAARKKIEETTAKLEKEKLDKKAADEKAKQDGKGASDDYSGSEGTKAEAKSEGILALHARIQQAAATNKLQDTTNANTEATKENTKALLAKEKPEVDKSMYEGKIENGKYNIPMPEGYDATKHKKYSDFFKPLDLEAYNKVAQQVKEAEERAAKRLERNAKTTEQAKPKPDVERKPEPNRQADNRQRDNWLESQAKVAEENRKSLQLAGSNMQRSKPKEDKAFEAATNKPMQQPKIEVRQNEVVSAIKTGSADVVTAIKENKQAPATIGR